MASKITRLRIAGASGALIGAGALAVALAAPASAAVTGVSITTPAGYGPAGIGYGTGCSYTVSASVTNSDPDNPVAFAVSPAGGGAVGPTSVQPSSETNKATTTWKPTKVGTYTITATQGAVTKSVTVKVGGRGIQTPSIGQINSSLTSGTCIVLPF